MGKKVFYKRMMIVATVFIVLINACTKPSNLPVITPGVTSIAGFVKNATNLTLLDSAMSKAGLLPTFDSLKPISVSGPFTFFAPLNVGFTAANFTDSTIYYDSVSFLQRLIKYHTIAGYAKTIAIFQTELSGQAPDFGIPSASGDTLYFTYDSAGLFVNGNLVTQTDIMAGNGVIQALSGLLIPPSGNLLQTLKSLSITDTTLTFLVEAIKKASTSTAYYNFDSLISQSGPFTFLAPTNAAFQAFGDTTIGSIDSSNVDTLARILQCHLIPARVFSSDFPANGKLLSYAGDSLTFNTLIGYTVQSPGDITPASIISVNRVATNGVIHKISQILYY